MKSPEDTTCYYDPCVVVVWMRTAPLPTPLPTPPPIPHPARHRLPYLDTRLGDYATFRRWSLSGRSMSLERALRICSTATLPACSLCFLCVLRCDLSAPGSSHLLPCSHMIWILPQELQVQINSFFHKSFLAMRFYHSKNKR